MLACLPLLASLGCAAGQSGPPRPDGGCAATSESGVVLAPAGRARLEVPAPSTARLRALLYKRGDQEGQAAPLAGQTVSFRILGEGQPASLSASEAVSDDSGAAEVSVTVSEAAQVQVEASSEGTCAVTFTVVAKDPLRRLDFIGGPAINALTHSAILVWVRASTDHNAPLAGETVQFKLQSGSTSSQALLNADDGTPAAETASAQTGSGGHARVRVFTGGQAVAELTLQATMSGAGTRSLKLSISPRSQPCSGDLDCDRGQLCDKSYQPPLCYDTGSESGSCRTDSDCLAPSKCEGGLCQPPGHSGQACGEPDDPLYCPEPLVCIAGYCENKPGQQGECQSNADCPPGYVCNQQHQCVPSQPPPGNPCDGTTCPSGQVCVDGTCQPAPCQSGSECPSGQVCVDGTCQPCAADNQCPSGEVCVNGKCVPKGTCATPHARERLAGSWKMESVLHLRQAVGPYLGAFLDVGGVLRDILDGHLPISGIPDWITDLVADLLRDIIRAYVPPWGQQLIVVLGDLDDILADMKVTETMTIAGSGDPMLPDEYRGQSKWELVEFTYRGQPIRSRPEDIPEVGQVRPDPFAAREVCSALFIDRHAIRNAVGGIIRWAIEVALTIASCATPGVPCYDSMDEALRDVLDCQAIGIAVADLVVELFPIAPDVSALVEAACLSQRDNLIDKLVKALDDITVQLALMALSGSADVVDDRHLANGKWTGTLGSGNFNGEFSASK